MVAEHSVVGTEFLMLELTDLRKPRLHPKHAIDAPSANVRRGQHNSRRRNGIRQLL